MCSVVSTPPTPLDTKELHPKWRVQDDGIIASTPVSGKRVIQWWALKDSWIIKRSLRSQRSPSKIGQQFATYFIYPTWLNFYVQ